MFQDKYVFAQLASFLNGNKFNRIEGKYDGDKYVKHFTCWNQLFTLMFSQLSNRESLRDLIVDLETYHSKCYHLGMGKNVSKSSLIRTNQDRDYHIFDLGYKVSDRLTPSINFQYAFLSLPAKRILWYIGH